MKATYSRHGKIIAEVTLEAYDFDNPAVGDDWKIVDIKRNADGPLFGDYVSITYERE